MVATSGPIGRSTSVPVDPPSKLLAVVEQLRVLEEQIDDAGSPGERAGWLAGLRQVVDTAEVMFTRALATFDALGDATVMSGQRDSTAWLHHELRLSAGDARSRVRVARDWPLIAGPLASVRDGDLRFEHARAMSAALRPLQHQSGQQQHAVPLLHDLAAQADPAAVRRAGRKLREVIDPDGALGERDRQFSRRHLRLSPLLDGMTAVDGVIDAEGSATLSAALAPLMVPVDSSDLRSAGQRRADALIEVAALALRSEQLPRLSGAVAAVDVVIPAAALLPQPPDAPGNESGSGYPRRPEPMTRFWDGVAVVRDAPGGPLDLSLEDVNRLLCDARVGRVLLGPDSAPLDVGRRVRLFSPEQRRALVVRDAGCRFPGCTRPPRYTDAHHLIPWQAGGATDLANALLLCRWHHNRVHREPQRGGWQIVAADPQRGSNGDLSFRGPAGQQLRSEPRAP